MILQFILEKFRFPTRIHPVPRQTGAESGHLSYLPLLRNQISLRLSEMHPLPILLPTCCRTLAVSSGKVTTSATQAASPAEKILTPMVGCASAAVAPSILAQTAGRWAGAAEKGWGAPSSLPLSCRQLGQQPSLSPWGAGRLAACGRTGEGGAQECGPVRQCPLPAFSPGTPTAPRWPRRAPCPRRGLM